MLSLKGEPLELLLTMSEVLERFPRVMDHVIALSLHQIVRLTSVPPVHKGLLKEGLHLIFQLVIQEDGRWRWGPNGSSLDVCPWKGDMEDWVQAA